MLANLNAMLIYDTHEVPGRRPESLFFEDFEARRRFVYNLGVLLSQTRSDVLSADLDEHDVVTVTFPGGHTKRVNVTADSYTAIIRDVLECL